MLVVISPAKRLDLSQQGGDLTTPEFAADAVALAAVANDLGAPALKTLMAISDNLARLNADRFAAFQAAPAPADLHPAIRIFAGDTYAGLEAATLDDDALRWAQGHLRILSGLYGLLRPMDGIQPYRLEMGSRLKTARGANLYDYWGDRLARALNDTATAAETDVLVNCASVEYFGAVDPAALRPRVITPVFMEERAGKAKIVSFFAKKARGAMARFICENRLTDARALREFDSGGYRYRADMSDGDRWVFLRDYPEA
ncbi:peroxide stress protein YaaA [Actibacterium sp. XHP0104]|uniref:peroxide stress protein YaaA n=1 Tax=Actibacterium sp. XHP0104 TaxID=2984335 RepID=UPI0021E75E8F|nr:peroxide stress protein YaaA [Actibacterium sp. XHP0104]MCV2881748.1 peroxide stress protein YaaA [Actibacterium sp. XHP0104]